MSRISCSRRLSFGLLRVIPEDDTRSMCKNQHLVEIYTIWSWRERISETKQRSERRSTKSATGYADVRLRAVSRRRATRGASRPYGQPHEHAGRGAPFAGMM